jgi:hypothetical protein
MSHLRYDTLKAHYRASKELHKTSHIQGYEIMIMPLIIKDIDKMICPICNIILSRHTAQEAKNCMRNATFKDYIVIIKWLSGALRYERDMR